MIPRSTVEKQLQFTLQSIDVPQLGEKYSGKVRDCFTVAGKKILITTDRLSAFDRVLTTIPFKGQILNAMASYWFRATAHLVPNHLLAQPHPNVFITRPVSIIPVEVVVRGYLAGSARRDYEAGRDISGVRLPRGLRKFERFAEPLLTPSTKAEHGRHDLPISVADIVRTGIVSAKIWDEVSRSALALFSFGTQEALRRGLLLVDTKYEFGIHRDAAGREQVLLADEIHTPDSSRYWVAETYPERFARGEDPEMLDKEFVRRWLIERGFMGDGEPPLIDDAFRVDTALRYIDVCERITGEPFSAAARPVEEEIRTALRPFLE